MTVLYRCIVVFVMLFSAEIQAEEYTLSVQPILSKEKTAAAYQPLADYLTIRTGHKIVIKAYRNFFTYWQKMKKDGAFDFVLDAAHFTDYRIKNNNYTVLVKIPDTVSFSLVTHEDVFVFEPEELVLMHIATMPSPGLGGIRLYEIFNDPARLPREVTVSNSSEAVAAIAERRVDAAIIPSPLVANFEFLNTVTTTKAIPHMAFSASPNVPQNVRQSILKALIEADKTVDGKLMLKAVGLPKFDITSNEEYAGYAILLKDVFGYKPFSIDELE